MTDLSGRRPADDTIRAAQAHALRDAAFAWTQGQWARSDATTIGTRIVVQADRVGEWLLERADMVNPPVPTTRTESPMPESQPEYGHIVAIAREAIAAVGGSHSHWRAGGVGGVCSTCESANERQRELGRRLDALVTPPVTTHRDDTGQPVGWTIKEADDA